MVYQWLRPLINRLADKLAGRLQRWVLPPQCVACGATGVMPVLPDCPDLCSACADDLPVNTPACIRCAMPLAHESHHTVCGACLRRPPHFAASFCAFRYAYPLEHLVRQLKYGQAVAQARVLGNLLAAYLKQHRDGAWPDCIVPVPLSNERYRERGYNQSIEVGRFVSRALRIPLRTDVINRVRHTSEQAGLHRLARRRNIRNAFAVREVTLPTSVALLDDVITTGSTVNEIARTLRKAGVQHVEVWAIARATWR